VRDDIPALPRAGFGRQVRYVRAIHFLNRLHEIRSDDVYPNVLRGSSRLLYGANTARGAVDLERAIELAPERLTSASSSPAGTPTGCRAERAFAEATLALDWGSTRPRVYAILASAYNASENLEAGAAHIQRGIELVTRVLVTTTPFAGRRIAFDRPRAGADLRGPDRRDRRGDDLDRDQERDFGDAIAVLLGPDGSPVVGSDDDEAYFAAYERGATGA